MNSPPTAPDSLIAHLCPIDLSQGAVDETDGEGFDPARTGQIWWRTFVAAVAMSSSCNFLQRPKLARSSRSAKRSWPNSALLPWVRRNFTLPPRFFALTGCLLSPLRSGKLLDENQLLKDLYLDFKNEGLLKRDEFFKPVESDLGNVNANYFLSS